MKIKVLMLGLMISLSSNGQSIRDESVSLNTWVSGDVTSYRFACHTPLDALQLIERRNSGNRDMSGLRCQFYPIRVSCRLIRKVKEIAFGDEVGAIWEVYDQSRDTEYLWLHDNRMKGVEMIKGSPMINVRDPDEA